MTTDNLIGTRLANYLIESALGHGGMAHVYRARDITLKRTVAIKVISPDLNMQEKYRERFEREAEAVAGLEHPNIVPVYYFGKEERLYYLAMKFIEGEDLAALMSRYHAAGEYLPVPDILSILEGVTQALDYAHASGVVHRDVKPSNILIDRQGHPYLTDFGLALNVRQGTIGEVFGTPHYIAPEQARSSADSVPQSDLYSLGVVIYELFTGVVPFDDPNPTAIAIQHLTKEPPMPRALNPELSPQVEAVILKALAKAPADRFSTGSSLLESLRGALQNAAHPREAREIPSLPPLPPGIEAPPPRLHSSRSVSAEVRASLAQRAAIESSIAASASQRINAPTSSQKMAATASTALESEKGVSWLIPLIALSGVIIGVIVIVAIVASTLNSPTIPEPPTALPDFTSTAIPSSPTDESPAVALAAATETVTPSDTPTTASPTDTPTTEPPSATPTTEAPTATLRPPSATPTPTLTPEPPSATPRATLTPEPPSATPTTEAPTATLQPPTQTPAPTVAALVVETSTPNDSGPAEPTSAPDDWLPVRFVYNSTTFYWVNLSQQNMLVSSIAFERANGEDRFEGWRLTQFFSRVEDGSCVQIMAFNARQMLPRPEGCGRINASMAANSNEGFWTGQRGRFRVFWNDVEVALCEIAAGQCDAALPPN